jgi:hypothetical protein
VSRSGFAKAIWLFAKQEFGMAWMQKVISHQKQKAIHV